MIWIHYYRKAEVNNQITDLNHDGKLLTAAKTIKKIDKTVNLQVHLDVQAGPVEGELPPFPCMSFTYSSNKLDPSWIRAGRLARSRITPLFRRSGRTWHML